MNKWNGNSVKVDNNIMGGAPCLAGTRIPVSSISYLHKNKKISLKEIVTKYYTQLSLDQVKAALEWSTKHKGNDMAS